MHPYRLDINHGTLRIDAVPLRFIIGLAYAVQTERVLGWPGWLNDERYDIQVKAENHALSENLTKWAYYAALAILRTARSSRLLTGKLKPSVNPGIE